MVQYIALAMNFMLHQNLAPTYSKIGQYTALAMESWSIKFWHQPIQKVGQNTALSIDFMQHQNMAPTYSKSGGIYCSRYEFRAASNSGTNLSKNWGIMLL